MSTRLALTVVVLVIGTTLWAPAALACSCISSGPACQAYWTADAVFDATVLGMRPLTPAERQQGGEPVRFADRIVALEVRQSWKGVGPGPLEVTTHAQESACGYPFRVGGRYLVFARKGSLGNRLHVSLCSLTQAFERATPALQFLESLANPSVGGRVFGTVKTSLRIFGPATDLAVETEVRLIGEGQDQTTISTDGGYEFSALPEGAYQIQLSVPDGYTTYSPARRVAIPDRRACAEANYWLAPDGQIAGRLVGPDGRGLQGVQVEVTTPDAQPAPWGVPSVSERADASGHFVVRNLPPGHYTVGVNLNDLPSERNPYARTMYTRGGSDPLVMTLALGEKIDLGTWQMPPPLEVLPLAGMIRWSDGTPAAGVYVATWDVTGNPVIRARGAGGATAASDGTFMLQVRRGRVYTFIARDEHTRLLPIQAPRVEIGAQPADPIHIVIRSTPRTQLPPPPR